MISLSFLFVIILSEAYATVTNQLTTNSELGKSVLQSSRRLNNDDDSVDYTWMANFSLKFQGCHFIKQWNEDADGEDEVRIKTSTIARSRLCPSGHCSKRNRKGCTKGYGDYVVGLDTYVSAYIEAQRRQDEYKCKKYMYKHCNCEDTDDKDMCEYKCYMKGRKYECIEQNPYYDDDASGQGLYRNDLRDFEKYFKGCTEFEQNYEDRRLEEDDDEITYYIGNYCADQGGKVYLGMFTDDTCTIFADKNAGRTTYKKLTGGRELPFSDYSMVRKDCISCVEKGNPEDEAQYGGNEDGDIRLNEQCEEVYESAGKCETQMATSYMGPSTINNNACYFLEGIKIMRSDGVIDTTFTRPNKVISFFIFLFAVSFVLLGAYIYYLRMKLGMKINLEGYQ